MNVREWALPVYTILMQLAVGSILVLWVLRWLASSRFNPDEMDRITRNPMMVILITVIAAMGGSHFHLSKPWLSFYAVRNFHTSWLSREVILTVLFFLTLILVWVLNRLKKGRRRLISTLGWLAILLGFSAVYCMARIYMLPTQIAWNSSSVIVSFFSTTLLLGSMAIACLLVLDLRFAEIQKSDDIEVRSQVIRFSLAWLVLVVCLAVLVNLVILLCQIFSLAQGDIVAQTSLQLLFDLYIPLFVLRLLFMLIAPAWIGYAVYRMHKSGSSPQGLMIPVYMSCLLILIGEILSRFLFYAVHIRVGI